MNFKIKLSTLFFFMILMTFNSCKNDDDCTCNGLFRYSNGTELLVPDVDCNTGEPGAPPTGSIPPMEPVYLGCDSANN